MAIISVVPGHVAVDASTGVETYTPNDATNGAKYLYARLLAASSSVTMMVRSGGGKATLNPDGSITPPAPPTTAPVTTSITPTAMHKQALAAQANLFAAWAVTDILPLLGVAVVIPATSAGDGLQTTTTTSNPTTHPSSPKTLTGALA